MITRLFFRAAYLVGFKPWDTGEVPPELQELVEGPPGLTPGQAMDLGCGTGTHAIYLARHGWQVTGVDAVDRALREARRKAADAGVSVRWMLGDVARVSDFAKPGSQRLFLDVGCFHGLPGAAHDDYARSVSTTAAPDALLLMWTVGPGLRWPMPRGVTPEEIGARFPGWEVQWSRKPKVRPRNPRFANAPLRWYLLKRRPTGPPGL